MGFLTSARAVIASAMADAMRPPPPPDITRWCRENIVFDERSPFPGPFSIRPVQFLAEIHAVLSPEHPCREVTLRGSAQIAKTESVINPTVAAWHEYMPLNSLVVHPTNKAATDWIDQKWYPIRRAAPSLRRMFGRGGGADKNSDAKFRQETLDRSGILKVTSAGSPDDLAQTSHRLVVMDDLSKFEMHAKGDPEAMAVSRAAAFEDAKILRASTPQILGACRISAAFARSDQRYYNVPCPHCGNMAPLTWENFKKRIDPQNLADAHFTCEACGCEIRHSDKPALIANGKWVATNPRGDHPGFHLWRAYGPQRDWASIAYEYAQVMGWTTAKVSGETEQALRDKVEAETEQTFWNDVLGLPYEQASKGPDWEKLRDRVENVPDGEGRGVGIVPARGVILTAGVDCQLDRTEVQVVAYGANYQRWVIEYRVIPHHVGSEEGRAALDALLKTTWRTEKGHRLPLDRMAIDGGTYTEDVWAFAKRWQAKRLIVVKGGSGQTGPIMKRMVMGDRKDARARAARRQGRILNVSQLKADFYTWLGKDDPLARGYVHFAKGLGDEYFRQITSEVRVLKRDRVGVMVSNWQLVEPTRRNEGLDTMIYSDAAARELGWTSMTREQWAALEAERGVEAPEDQPDLFETQAAVQVAPVEDGVATVQTRQRRLRGRAR
ncbi:Phage terminase, large subunit GpA [Mameliella alba]|uniref:phage terminase large subunit family protein n=1 Tax=Mameliella alba TaxID=561184 RepID=UPI00088A69D7|nr:terminase gpA endonuclease subunit [Mameliella alba]OWV48248.1 terminase [Mameliella alba]PTR40289.1 phage terminase large subunit GpA-like protein [Mameliella alba]GGF43757.1 terminase [Mameliella alba]SDC98302.1 Phage terminase, large subunit GpA [Mameliella alba]